VKPMAPREASSPSRRALKNGPGAWGPRSMVEGPRGPSRRSAASWTSASSLSAEEEDPRAKKKQKVIPRSRKSAPVRNIDEREARRARRPRYGLNRSFSKLDAMLPGRGRQGEAPASFAGAKWRGRTWGTRLINAGGRDELGGGVKAVLESSPGKWRANDAP